MELGRLRDQIRKRGTNRNPAAREAAESAAQLCGIAGGKRIGGGDGEKARDEDETNRELYRGSGSGRLVSIEG